MFWTNVFLVLAFIGMIGGFVWLFRDGEGPAPQPGIMRKPNLKSGQTPTDDDPREASSEERKD